MKTHRYIKRYLSQVVGLLLACVGGLTMSCNSDNIDDEAMYTFTGETVASFCKNTPELTLFYQALEKSGTTALLSVYGHFTCFAPTNAAVETYLNERNLTIESMSEEDLKKMVYNCTIRSSSSEYESVDFQEGALATPSMSDRYLVISFSTNELGQRETIVNKSSKIVSIDNEVHNGVVHVVDKVIEPSEENFLNVLKEHGSFNVWAAAYEATGYDKQMEGLYDENYVNPYSSSTVEVSGYQMKVCDQCRLGYTMFCEPDELLAQHGITTIEELENYATTYYGTSNLGEYTNPENPLNKFVAYHLLNRQMSTNSFIYSGAATAPSYTSKRYEYYETMLKYRLMEFKAGNKINERKNGMYVGIDEQKSNIDVVNGFIHTLTDMLVYDEDVMRTDVLHKRIRFDFYAVPPQLTNNNIRWQLTNIQDANGYTITPDFCGEYFTYNDVSKVVMWASEGWTNYQADELKVNGWYDFTLRMLPVPPGNYEIRLGYRAESWRGVSQLFIDGQIAGIPVDLTIGVDKDDLRVGWKADDETSDNGVENDKMMRNRGYMKAPSSIYTPQNGGTVLRNMYQALRIIIGQYSFDDYAPHYFRAKNVESEDREFHFDYLEYIPVDMIRDEDRE